MPAHNLSATKVTSLQVVWLFATVWPVTAFAGAELRNNCYALEVAAGGETVMRVAGLPPQRLVPEFTVLWSEAGPRCRRDASHPNYAIAPRVAVRWRNPEEPLETLNAWLASPEMKFATGLSGSVGAEGKGRAWEFRDAKGRVTLRVTGDRAFDTTRPFTVGHRVVMRPVRSTLEANRVRWAYAAQEAFTLAAELALPAGGADPEWTFTLTPKRDASFSIAFTGAPDAPLAKTLPVPQECEARGHRQFNYVMSEADLHLPRVQVATAAGNLALVADPRECRFRLPTFADARFGFMLQHEAGRLKPVLLAPLLGGPESRMRAGEPWRFTFRCVLRAGDWKETHVHISRAIHGFRDQRDNSGPGPLNGALERVIDFLADRHGRNFALWDPQQKYYDYFTDKTGVFKPFSPLYGLSVAIVTDDEAFFRRRALPAVEYSLSRRTSVFAPYDTADNKQARSFGRELGAPYLSYAQLVSLHELFQRRSPVLRSLAEAKGPVKGKIADALARWRLTGDATALAEAKEAAAKVTKPGGVFGEEMLFDLLELADTTRDAQHVHAAAEAAYHLAAKLNLYPAPPDTMVTVERGGVAPVHFHSFGRHRNVWGFPPPQPLRALEQTVPSWRIARLGLPGIAYPIEYWMNPHGALMRIAALTHDEFLRDLARWGMVGRFGNYPGDNRSQDSLVPELPDAVERPPWGWNFATVNPGHAWDFAGAVLDFLVSDAFERSCGAIDFPALSAAGSQFRVRIYGGKAGRFYSDENVRLWLPRGLVTSDNRQLNWLAGYGNGYLYLALINQSFREERANLTLNRDLAECQDGHARCWQNNERAGPVPIGDNRMSAIVPAKGILALAIPATVKPRLQGKLYGSNSAPLPEQSVAEVAAPFGRVHAMLLRAGRDLTRAFVYAEALPEQVIAARLRGRQGGGAWQEMTDDSYPYEFSPELRDDLGDYECLFEIEDAQQKVLRSTAIKLVLADAAPRHLAPPPDGAVGTPRPTGRTEAEGVNARSFIRETGRDEGSEAGQGPISAAVVRDDFVAYLQRAANGSGFGLRADGRYYPYSTPQGRRIAWRQPVWDKAHYASGCSREEAERHLRTDLSRTFAELKRALASRLPAVEFGTLDRRQQETLLDFAQTEGVAGLRPELVAAVLAREWKRMVDEHLHIRYAGHAPDHARNKAFVQRWSPP